MVCPGFHGFLECPMGMLLRKPGDGAQSQLVKALRVGLPTWAVRSCQVCPGAGPGQYFH